MRCLHRGHVSSPLPPPPTCGKPDEVASPEVGSHSIGGSEGVVGASKATELGRSLSSRDGDGGNDDCESTAVDMSRCPGKAPKKR